MIPAAQTSSSVVLVASRKDGCSITHTLQADQGVFIGRSDNCGLQLLDTGLSDIHCRIGLEDGKVWVQDWMSQAGTFLNGNRIDTKSLLDLDSVLVIGECRITVRTSIDPDVHEPTSETTTDPVAVDQATNSGQDSGQRDFLANTESMPSESAHGQANMINDYPNDPEPHLEIPPATSDADVEIPFDFEADFFEAETYDRETVELMQAEIADLRAALAAKDAEQQGDVDHFDLGVDPNGCSEQSDAMLQRIKELSDEAQRSDERVALLEEMLQASEEASRNEHEERQQLEGWVGDIERRIGQRETEHSAEIEALQHRVQQAVDQRDLLQKKLQQAASQGNAPKQYEETLENLQTQNKKLQDGIAAAEKERLALEQRLETSQSLGEDALREERALIAQERAKVSRLRFELSNKLSGLEEIPKSDNDADRESALRLRTLREHLREIHEEEKREAAQASLATRVKKLWNRIEY